MLTDTIFEDDRWEAAGLAALSERGAVAALAHLGLDPAEYEIAVLGCDDARIAALNGDFRDKPTATNVLSWPSEDLAAEDAGGTPFPPEPEDEEPHHLGDIALAWENLRAGSRRAGYRFRATCHTLGCSWRVTIYWGMTICVTRTPR